MLKHVLLQTVIAFAGKSTKCAKETWKFSALVFDMSPQISAVLVWTTAISTNKHVLIYIATNPN